MTDTPTTLTTVPDPYGGDEPVDVSSVPQPVPTDDSAARLARRAAPPVL